MPERRNESLLDADALTRAESLGLLARSIVEGYRVGEHRSPFHGFAIEFAQHREYTPGDDTRHLDWKMLGRTDRYYIKQYEQDTNFVAHLVLDGSESMNYGSGRLTKLQFGKVLTACLAYLILAQRDAVSMVVFDEDTKVHVQRTDNAAKIHEMMHRLAEFESAAGTRLGRALELTTSRLRGREIVVLISDLFDDEDAFRRGLDQIRFRGSEVIVFHTLDPAELKFDFRGTVRFLGLEGTGTQQTSPADIRKSYLQVFDAYRKRIRQICENAGCHYVLADVGEPLAEVLSGYLAFRSKVSR